MARFVAFLLATLLALAGAASAGAQERTGRILASLERGGEQTAALGAAVAARAGAAVAGPAEPRIGMVSLRPRAPSTAAAVLARLREDPRVRAAAPEGRFTLRYLPNDPALRAGEPDGAAPPATPLQWALARQGFPSAWEVTSGDGAVVAVLDTGVDATHAELQGKIAGSLDLDEENDIPATTDGDGHGTHVGSLACAATDNAFGLAGAGFHCRLFVIRTDLTDGSVARGIVAAAEAGADALNMSFGDDGSSPSPAIADALRYAAERGVVLVAAAADEPVEEQGEPANLLQPPGTAADLSAGLGLSVTAATIDDQRAGFAGRGTQVSLAAYGALRSDDQGARGLIGAYPSIETPREGPTVFPPSPGCGCRFTLDGDDRYALLPGTSMSAPQVAAAAALVGHLNRDLSALEVVRILKETARRPDGAGWSPELGWGILDAGAAVDAARRVDRRAPNSRVLAPSFTRARRITIRLRGRDRSAAGLIASGVSRFQIHRSVDGGRVRRIGATSRRAFRVRVQPGRQYAFYSVAIDNAGNRESLPARPDARVSAL